MQSGLQPGALLPPLSAVTFQPLKLVAIKVRFKPPLETESVTPKEAQLPPVHVSKAPSQVITSLPLTNTSQGSVWAKAARAAPKLNSTTTHAVNICFISSCPFLSKPSAGPLAQSTLGTKISF